MLMKTKPPQRPTLIWSKQTSASVIDAGKSKRSTTSLLVPSSSKRQAW